MAIAQRILQMPVVADLRSDRNLVRAAQKGDRGAVSALIERYYPRVHSFVAYMGANGHSEDLTQEVFARALTALPRFNGSYKVGPWLLRIAKNLCIDESRRENFRPDPVDPAALVEIEKDDSVDNVWESVSQHLIGSVVRDALTRLPARQRAALVLREIEHLSYTEIAQVIGTNTRGAEATLRRARARFRMEVANSEGLEAERAACQRILRQLANDDATPIEVAKHLRACAGCRTKASSIRAADKLFGSLPPLVLGPAVWKSNLLSKVRPRNVRPRTLLEVLRGRAEFGLLSPISQLAEMVTSLAVATTVSVASVAGLVNRVVVVAPAPPGVSAVDATAATSSEGPGESSESAGSSAAPQITGDASGAGPGEVAAPEDVLSADPAIAESTRLRDRVTELLSSQSETAREAVEDVTDLAIVAGTEATSTPPVRIPDLPSQDDIQTSGTLPTGISLPRRRPRPWPA